MNPHSTRDVKPKGEPAPFTGVDDPQARKDGCTEPRRRRRRRRFKSAWRHRTGRQSSGAEPTDGPRRLSAGEEQELAERGKGGDVEAVQQLITANLALVLRAVRDYKHCGVPMDDLIQEGNLGLIRAAQDFDPSTHTARFATYATYWIRCFMVRALASNGSLIQRPEHLHLLRLQYREAVGELRARGAGASGDAGSETPSLDEVAGYLGVSARRLEEARLNQDEPGVCQRLGDLTPADGPPPDHELVTNEDRAMVCAALRRLSPFEAWVICERFGLGEPPGRGIRANSPARDLEQHKERRMILAAVTGESLDRGARSTESYFQRSYIDMGRDCGLSVFRLRQVEKTALDKLRAFLGRRIAEGT